MNTILSHSFTRKAGLLFGGAAVALALAAGSAQAASVSVAQTRGPIWISIPTSGGALQSITVTAPATGNMIVTAAGSVEFEHTLGTQGDFCVSLSQTSGDTGGCVPNAGSDSAMRSYIAAGFPTTVPGFGTHEGYSIVRVYKVSVGVKYTFYVNGYEQGMTSASLFQPSLTALWVPGTLH
jgi:hypothetical protein